MMAFGTFNRGGTPGPMSEINMIPLIDVMLVLLVIFMITAPLLTHAIKIDLPQATAAVQQPKADKIEISIDGEGALFWNGEPIDLATIKTRFDTAALQSPSMEISILSALGCCTAAVAFGKSVLIACVSRGAVIMKITSRNNITSINEIMLISDMGPGVPPLLKLPNAGGGRRRGAGGGPAARGAARGARAGGS